MNFPDVASGASEGGGEGGVREISGYQCTTKSTFLHVSVPGPPMPRRRQRSAPPSASSSCSSSDASTKPSDSSLLSQMNRMLLDDNPAGGPGSASDWDDDDEVEADTGEAESSQKRGKPRASQGQRARFKRFAGYMERRIRAEPEVDLSTIVIPPYIRKDRRFYAKLMVTAVALKAQAMRGELPPEAEDEGASSPPVTPRVAAKRKASPGTRSAAPEAKRAAGPARGTMTMSL